MASTLSIHEKIDNAAREIGIFGKYQHEVLMKGYAVELEHGKIDPVTNVTDDDVVLTIKIVAAHLKEFPDYYERLEVLESDEFWARLNDFQAAGGSNSSADRDGRSPKRQVFVTVPHSTCPSIDRGHHPCDTIAGRAASELVSALTERGFEVQLFLGTIHRDLTLGGIDLNRAESRSTAFRTELSEEMLKAVANRPPKYQTPVLIDVHSFPAESEGEFGVEPAVVMDPLDSRLHFTSYALDFIRVARSMGNSIGLVRGGVQNDIVTEAKKAGMIAFLLEINESRSRQDQRAKLWKAVADWAESAELTAF